VPPRLAVKTDVAVKTEHEAGSTVHSFTRLS